jgi:hypothetical protein
MGTLREFELEAIRIMGHGVLTPEQMLLISELAEPAHYEYTGSGYFLTVSHPDLPALRATLSSPVVVGECGQIICGFVVFLSDHELTLECHTWGDVPVPPGFRKLAVLISQASED